MWNANTQINTHTHTHTHAHTWIHKHTHTCTYTFCTAQNLILQESHFNWSKGNANALPLRNGYCCPLCMCAKIKHACEHPWVCYSTQIAYICMSKLCTFSELQQTVTLWQNPVISVFRSLWNVQDIRFHYFPLKSMGSRHICEVKIDM